MFSREYTAEEAVNVEKRKLARQQTNVETVGLSSTELKTEHKTEEDAATPQPAAVTIAENPIDKIFEAASNEKKSEASKSSKPGVSVFVKNLNFSTKDEGLLEFFLPVGGVRSAVVRTKANAKNPSGTATQHGIWLCWIWHAWPSQ